MQHRDQLDVRGPQAERDEPEAEDLLDGQIEQSRVLVEYRRVDAQGDGGAEDPVPAVDVGQEKTGVDGRGGEEGQLGF
jgi:hypothetical protein